MSFDDRKFERLNEILVRRLGFLLYAQFPFIDFGAPSQPPAHLRRDLGLPPEDMLKHWRDFR